jgi:hypothetical protein
MRFKQVEYLRKLIIYVKEMMKEKKFFLIKIKLDKLNSFSELHNSDEVLGE